MSFLETRRRAIRSTSLSLALTGEDVTIMHHGNQKTCRVNVQQEQYGRQLQQKSGMQQQQQGTLDEWERVRVTFDRDPDWEFGGIDSKPNVGETLERDVDHDLDRRPFTFTGEIEIEAMAHATYIYQRPRRTSQGRRV